MGRFFKYNNIKVVRITDKIQFLKKSGEVMPRFDQYLFTLFNLMIGLFRHICQNMMCIFRL
jgi:hypothetical protein